MTTDHFSKVKNAIDELSKEQSYKSVCHPHFKDHKMPSISALEQIVNLAREVIFPGYYGDSSIRPESVRYYIGVNTEKLYSLLVEQVFAGLCFMCDKPESFDLSEKKSLAHDYSSQFISELPKIRELLATDVEAAFLGVRLPKVRVKSFFAIRQSEP